MRSTRSSSRTSLPLAIGALALLPVFGCDCDAEPINEATGAVSGKICNPLTGAAEAGAVLSTTYDSAAAGGPVDRELEAAGDGTFTISGVPEGEQTFTVTADDFSYEFTIEVVASDTVTFVDEGCRELALPAGEGEIIGQVCNRHVGEFVDDATVKVILPDGTELSTSTDDNGNFVLSEVPAGVHIVYVNGTGYSRTYQVEVKDGEQTLLEEQQRTCEPPDPSSTGAVHGIICVDDDQGVAGVRVFVTNEIDGVTYEDYTAEDGSFTIAGIPAPRTVQIRAQRAGFSFTWNDVQIYPLSDQPEGTVLSDTVACTYLVPDDGVNYLVVNGFYDKIQNVLDRMELPNVTITEGNPVDPSSPWAAGVFGDYAALNEYDAVFINCGVSESEFIGTPDPVVAQNLRQYVQQGGSLYVSDQAYDIIELVWPDRIDFLFGDSDNSAAEAGADGLHTMDISEPGLRDFVGQDTIDIDFNFGYFAIINEVASGTTVYLRGDIPYNVNNTVEVKQDTPVTVGFTDGAPGVGGRVIFTSFHQESDATTGETEVLDGPEDAVLRYLVFEL
jgi:hypothetical protein